MTVVSRKLANSWNTSSNLFKFRHSSKFSQYLHTNQATHSTWQPPLPVPVASPRFRFRDPPLKPFPNDGHHRPSAPPWHKWPSVGSHPCGIAIALGGKWEKVVEINGYRINMHVIVYSVHTCNILYIRLFNLHMLCASATTCVKLCESVQTTYLKNFSSKLTKSHMCVHRKGFGRIKTLHTGTLWYTSICI